MSKIQEHLYDTPLNSKPMGQNKTMPDTYKYGNIYQRLRRHDELRLLDVITVSVSSDLSFHEVQ